DELGLPIHARRDAMHRADEGTPTATDHAKSELTRVHAGNRKLDVETSGLSALSHQLSAKAKAAGC
ncbi:MAG TPA: hypothetical protein VFJ90_14885, partial [Candidatus Didemnitutus sp.]|nr:hypothetical protein [Candidatus Didemnitutus sp.]